MAADRRLHVIGRLASGGPGPLHTARLCEVSAEMTSTSGAGIMLMTNGEPRGAVCTSNSVSQLLDELQFTMGEGPSIDACREDLPVLEPDLVSPATVRWIAFSPPAIAAGARAVFGFPIRVGTGGLGALHLYRDRPGPLTDEQHSDALVLADVAAEVILLLQANTSPGELAAELESSASFHYVVHQASGMVSAQLDVSVDHAMARLRAFAFSSGRPLNDVARSVVDRTLRFDPASGLGIDQ